MSKLTLSKLFFTLLLIFISQSAFNTHESYKSASKILDQQIFHSDVIDEIVLDNAISGYFQLWQQGDLQNPQYLTVIDFTKSSNELRFFLIDMKVKKVVASDYVAHGRNSGNELATRFSNTPSSLQSSLGFYTTAETYFGKHGYSLRLDGQEPNINCKARERAIVMHGADYVSESFIKQHGRLGRSFGCPALSKSISKSVIDKIKDGSCLYIYHSNADYHNSTTFQSKSLPANWWSMIFEE